MRAENATSMVDGNALAGIMADLLGGEITQMNAVCGGCGAAGPLAETVVELDDAAAIVRCRSCTHTLLTVLRDGGQVRIVIGMLRELARG